jgi:hypothetical protein
MYEQLATAIIEARLLEATHRREIALAQAAGHRPGRSARRFFGRATSPLGRRLRGGSRGPTSGTARPAISFEAARDRQDGASPPPSPQPEPVQSETPRDRPETPRDRPETPRDRRPVGTSRAH